MSSDQPDNIEQLLLKAGQAAKILGVGKTTFYQLHSSGLLGPMPVEFPGVKRSLKLWRLDELRAWCAAGCPVRERWLAMKKGGE